jgi:hypothetical protein
MRQALLVRLMTAADSRPEAASNEAADAHAERPARADLDRAP